MSKVTKAPLREILQIIDKSKDMKYILIIVSVNKNTKIKLPIEKFTFRATIFSQLTVEDYLYYKIDNDGLIIYCTNKAFDKVNSNAV